MMTLPQTKATVFHGGKVVQFDRHAKTVTEHDCLVSIGSTIIYVGSDDETKVAELVQNVPLKNVQHVDLKGRYLLPGFIDSHVHLLEFSLAKYEANKLSLKGVKGVEAVKAAIMDYREKHSHLNVIICTDWLRDKDDKEDDIVAKTLDEVDSEHPIIIEAADSHSSWCNQKTMDHAEFKLKDITDKYPYDPSKPNPQVKYDHDGKACGYFAESAHLVYVHKFLFDIHTPEQRQEALKNACKLYHEAGYTGIVGMFTKQYEWDVLEEFMKQQKEDSGEYPFHYGTYWAAPDKAGVKEAIEWHKNHRKTGNKEFCVLGMKIISDGVIDGHTASLFRSYKDTEAKVAPLWSTKDLNDAVCEAHEQGLQCAIHAIGDQAVNQAVNAYEIGGHPEARHRIEHLEVAGADDIKRLKKLGIIASIQPVASDINALGNYEPCIGEVMWNRVFPYREIVDEGVEIALGSDAPTAPHDALGNLYIATTRRSAWERKLEARTPGGRLGLVESIAAASAGSAYARFAENWTGSLYPGLQADLVVLESDWTPGGLLDSVVHQTWYKGNLVYENKTPEESSKKKAVDHANQQRRLCSHGSKH